MARNHQGTISQIELRVRGADGGKEMEEEEVVGVFRLL